jgi:predicted nucleic acid-binding protein
VANRIYVDTNVFIIGFESADDHARAVRDFLSALRKWPGRAVTSELTLAELLAPVSRPRALPESERRRLYLDLLIWSGLIDLYPVSRDVLIEAADLRKVVRHKLPDAIHVVIAARAHCAHFLADDEGLTRLPRGMRRLRADRSGIDEALRALTPADDSR